MLVTPHAVVGATVGALIPIPALALPIALGSHFLLDTIPHWQETLPPYTPHRGTWIRVPLDLAAALLCTQWIAGRCDDAGLVRRSALAGVAPDLDFFYFLAPQALGRVGGIRQYVAWHAGIQRETARLWGLIPQVGALAVCGALVYAGRTGTGNGSKSG